MHARAFPSVTHIAPAESNYNNNGITANTYRISLFTIFSFCAILNKEKFRKEGFF